jgi:hypothetical protein
MHLAHELDRLTEVAGGWIVSPVGYLAALLLPVVLLAVADWLVRGRRQ